MDLAEKARVLLRAVPEVALDREWTRKALMRDREGNLVLAGSSSTKQLQARVGDRLVSRECGDVAACCTIGWIELASFCSSGRDDELVDTAVWQAAIDVVTEKLLELGWAESALRQTWEELREDGLYGDDYETWREEVVPDDVGEEGLLALWNDSACEGKEQSLDLIARAAA